MGCLSKELAGSGPECIVQMDTIHLDYVHGAQKIIGSLREDVACTIGPIPLAIADSTSWIQEVMPRHLL